MSDKLRALNTTLEKIITERTYQLEEVNAELEETSAMLEEEIEEISWREDVFILQFDIKIDGLRCFT